MAKIIVSKRNPKRAKRSLIRLKKFRAPNGKITTVATLDSEDPDFGLKLEAVFKRNVARAIERTAEIADRPRRRVAGKN